MSFAPVWSHVRKNVFSSSISSIDLLFWKLILIQTEKIQWDKRCVGGPSACCWVASKKPDIFFKSIPYNLKIDPCPFLQAWWKMSLAPILKMIDLLFRVFGGSTTNVLPRIEPLDTLLLGILGCPGGKKIDFGCGSLSNTSEVDPRTPY